MCNLRCHFLIFLDYSDEQYPEYYAHYDPSQGSTSMGGIDPQFKN